MHSEIAQFRARSHHMIYAVTPTLSSEPYCSLKRAQYRVLSVVLHSLSQKETVGAVPMRARASFLIPCDDCSTTPPIDFQDTGWWVC